jgi:transcriptional regulator GlxA family with amidase domain
MPDPPPIRVDILARTDTSPSTLFGLYDVLSSVGVGWETFVSGKPEVSRFDVRIIAASERPFRCAGGVLVSPKAGLEGAGQADVAIVASLVTPSWAPPTKCDEREMGWLSQQQSRGAVVASACTGAIVLAESGLLNGLEATTHWAYGDLFRVHYPDVRLRLEKNLCLAGRNEEVVTSGGATGWQELALHLIVRFCGVKYATRAARFWLIPNQEEYQSPYAALLPRGIPHDDGIVKDCQLWIADNYAQTNPVSRMTLKSGVPPATFARRFKRATGYHPMDYVHALRVEEAKQMLETTDQAIDEIGHEVGYEDPASFRRLFKRKTMLTPAAYRRRFGKARFERYELSK